jgi:Mitochondrial ribosomal protein subunit
MAATAMAAVPSPSPFATLLRRSQFASFDPKIGQVYTTHNGNAHRGNWGFKRPLALRKRDKFISVQAVDSPEQQTEWTPRESEARFIQRWGEVAATPQVRNAWEKLRMNSRPTHHAELAKVDKSGNIVDPAVRRKVDECFGKRQYVASSPLVSAMGSRQFARYLEKLRRQRPEFLQFLSDQSAHTRNPNAPTQVLVAPSAYEESALGSAEIVRRKFLQRQSHTRFEAPDSRAIEQRPHHNGGLSYACSSQLTHFFTTHEEPGRFVDSQNPEGRTVTRASFAGMAANLKTQVIDYDTGSKFRIVEAVLRQAPNVVSAQPQGLDGAVIDVIVEDVGNIHMTRANPFSPGSRAYITHSQTIVPPRSKRSVMISKPVPRRETSPEGNATKELLSTLRDIIHGFPSGGDEKNQ